MENDYRVRLIFWRAGRGDRIIETIEVAESAYVAVARAAGREGNGDVRDVEVVEVNRRATPESEPSS